jgi:hypothetical protein
MPIGMRRTAKLALTFLAVAGIFFLLPLVPRTMGTYELFDQHGWCYNAAMDPTQHLYASVSYNLFQYGVVYVRANPVDAIPKGGYLWWLASDNHPDCI